MGYSRDEHPWVGPVPGKPNLYISAGYTGHGMPNTWLCGRAVAKIIEAEYSMQISGAEWNRLWPKMLHQPGKTGIPKSYIITEERLKRAMELDDVEAVDWAEMARARRRQRSDRMPSGYA